MTPLSVAGLDHLPPPYLSYIWWKCMNSGGVYIQKAGGVGNILVCESFGTTVTPSTQGKLSSSFGLLEHGKPSSQLFFIICPGRIGIWYYVTYELIAGHPKRYGSWVYFQPTIHFGLIWGPQPLLGQGSRWGPKVFGVALHAVPPGRCLCGRAGRWSGAIRATARCATVREQRLRTRVGAGEGGCSSGLIIEHRAKRSGWFCMAVG